MQDISLDRLKVFAEVAQHRSVTAAARALGMSKAAVSQHIRRLEAALGVQLCIRTTRTLALTDAGTHLHADCSEMLKRAAATLSRVRLRASSAAGRLRITAPQDLAPVVAQAVSRLLDQHPEVAVEVLASDTVLNPVEAGIDVSVRVGWLRDSRLRAVLLRREPILLVASPHYLARAGTPTTTEDLARHRWVLQMGLAKGATWRFTCGRRTVQVAPRGDLQTNSTLVVKALLVSGAAIGILPQHLVAAELRSGALVRVLADCKLADAGIFAVHPYEPQFAPAQVKAFIAALRAEFLSQPVLADDLSATSAQTHSRRAASAPR